MNAIDERIAAELTRLAPYVDEHLAWQRIESAARMRERHSRFRLIAMAAAAAGLVLVALIVGPQLLQLTQGPVVGGGGDPDVLRADGDVLTVTSDLRAPSALVAVNPSTGEERVIADGLADVRGARWSGDGRWVGYRLGDSLWVVDATSEPRQVFDGLLVDHSRGPLWAWSSTGGRLALVHESSLLVVDAATGQVTELVSTEPGQGDVLNSGGDITTGESVTSSPAWSPDGSTIVFGARGGSIHAVDATTGEMSLLVQLPGIHLDSIDGLAWSHDGSRLAILADRSDRSSLFVVDADGTNLVLLADFERSEASITAFDWSPDGSRIAYNVQGRIGVRLAVAPADGSAPPVETLIYVFDDRLPVYPEIPAWSPDGTLVGVGGGDARLTATDQNYVVQADGSGAVSSLDDLTYESWRGGGYDGCARSDPESPSGC